MVPITAKQYIEEHSETFDFIELLKALDPHPSDRQLIENEIRNAVTEIANDASATTLLKRLTLKISMANFRILRSSTVECYWNAVKLHKIAVENALKQNLAATRELQERYSCSFNTRSRDARRANNNQDELIYEIDGVMLAGMENSASSVIKQKAVKLAKSKATYASLTNDEKNIMSLGLNSIIDLSNNTPSKTSQRGLFTDKAWQELKNRVYHSRQMRSLPNVVATQLKDIEQLAYRDLKSAYKLSLSMQKQYALLPEEIYFEIYSHVIRLLARKDPILTYPYTKSSTEQDFVGSVWTPIFSSVFNCQGLRLKWGESVYEMSTTARKRIHSESVMGDRVDMRVITNIAGIDHDMINGEYASERSGAEKFSSDHRKVLREAKVILDNIANQKHIQNSEIKRTLIPCFQAAGLNGEFMILTLTAPGLYTAQHMGSVSIPDNARHLYVLRKKVIPRLLYMKNQAIKNSHLLASAISKNTRVGNKKTLALRRSPSQDSIDTEVDIRWTRGTWFPSRRPSDPIVIPSDLV